MGERTVLHYRLADRLGTGASGDVYLAEDLRLHRPVALKMLRADEEGSGDAAGRLLREARVASSLSHPNIAVVYEVGEVEHEGRRRGFIAMEHVSGRTVQDRLRDGPLPPAEALAIVRQVAEALVEAHERGVVHRDVKPGNVMVTERGLVKVLDFGLAKFAPPSAEGAATWSGRHGALEGGGAILGTLAYMSPEQARGGEVDARSDVYSLGALLYETLGGRPPFTGTNAVEMLEALLRDDPPPLPASTPLGEALGRLALSLLVKDREKRPGTMVDVLRALEDVAAGRLLAPETVGDAIAVMSFANLTRNAEHDWLGTGIAETLAVGLSALPGASVLSRERIGEVLRKLGVPAESDDPAVAVRLGRELGARSVVSGGYQVLGDGVRVTTRVIDVESSRTTLTHKLDGTRTALFDLQDRLVAELGSLLRGQLSAPPPPRGEETKSLEAYEAFSRGLLNLRSESREALDRAILFFEQAISFDPAYARAHMQLGNALDVKGEYLGNPRLSEQGLASVDLALALDPACGETWRAKGAILVSLGRDEEALAAFEKALSANPTDARAHSGIGRVHFVLRGEFREAMASYERSLALDPDGGWAALQCAHCAVLARDFEKAVAWARRAIVLQQQFLTGRTGIGIVGAFVRLGQAFALQGRHADAIAEYERELTFLKEVDHGLRGRIFIELHQRLGEARLQLGDAQAGRLDLDLALEAFDRRLRNGADDPMTRYYAACAYALRGEVGGALTSLEKAADKRLRLTVARGRIEPALESLHGEPRFEALLSRWPQVA